MVAVGRMLGSSRATLAFVIAVTVATDIDRPAAAVFDFVSNFENNGQWQTGVEATEWTTPPPIGIGSTYTQRMRYRGLTTKYRVTGLVPGTSISTETLEGADVPTSVTRSVAAVAGGSCVITVELFVHPRGWRRLIQPLMRRAIAREVTTDYNRLKRLLEGEESDG